MDQLSGAVEKGFGTLHNAAVGSEILLPVSASSKTLTVIQCKCNCMDIRGIDLGKRRHAHKLVSTSAMIRWQYSLSYDEHCASGDCITCQCLKQNNHSQKACRRASTAAATGPAAWLSQYQQSLCFLSVHQARPPKCWNALLKHQNGALSG